MGMFHHHSRGGKRLQRKTKSEHHSGVRLAALLLCLSMLTGFLPAIARAEESEHKFSDFVAIDSIALYHYKNDPPKNLGEKVEDNALLTQNDPLILYYEYHITESQCDIIKVSQPVGL